MFRTRFRNIFLNKDEKDMLNYTETYIRYYKIIEGKILFYTDSVYYLSDLKSIIDKLESIFIDINTEFNSYNYNNKKINNNLEKITKMETVILFNKNRITQDMQKYNSTKIGNAND